MIAEVKYDVATYSGTVTVPCEPDEDDVVVLARAKAQLLRRSGGHWPVGVERFQIVRRTR